MLILNRFLFTTSSINKSNCTQSLSSLSQSLVLGDKLDIFPFQYRAFSDTFMDFLLSLRIMVIHFEVHISNKLLTV